MNADIHVMPFGKHKGVAITELSDHYLNYIRNWEPLRDPAKAWITEEIARRANLQNGGGAASPADMKSSPPRKPAKRARELIEVGWGGLVSIHHPDVGGTYAALQESREAREWLTGLVNEAQSGGDNA